MSGSLITLPLRLSLRATGLAVSRAREVVERAAGLTHDDPPLPDFHSAPDAPPTRVEPPPRPVQTQTAAPAASAHIDTDDELVEEVAEPGAEDGAGAQVRIAEPWTGYPDLRAADVISRLAAASPEELAAIEPYELSNRKRKTVIAAAQRQLTRRR
jgi:hypothetical protein